MPSSVSGKPVDSSGSITPAADGSSAHLVAARPRGCETRAAARGRTAASARATETDRATDGSVEQPRPTPAHRPRRRASAASRIGQRGAGARDAVVESQHPDPAAVETRDAAPHRRRDTAASRRAARSAIPALDAFEVRVERLRRRQPAAAARRRRPSARWRNPRGPLASMTKPRRDPDRPAVALPSSTMPVAVVPDALEPCLVQIDRAFRLGLAHERVVEVRPVPMRIGDLVVRARGDQQLPRVLARRRRTRSPGSMEEEREPAFEAARDVRTRPLPGAPLRERAGAAADRSDPRAPRAAGWPAASTIRRSRTADGGRAR